MPTIHEMPTVEVLVSEDAPSPINPLGVKGAGEGGASQRSTRLSAMQWPTRWDAHST